MKTFIPNVNAKKLKSIRKRLPTIFEDAEHYWSESEISSSTVSSKSSTFDYKVEYDFTTEKIDGKNVRTWINERKGDLFEIKQVLSFNYSTQCTHRWIFDVEIGEYICNKCLMIETKIENKDESFQNQNSNLRIWIREHDRNRWTREDLEYCRGHMNDQLTDQFWIQLMREVETNFKWYQVYKIFQQYGLKKLWMGFGAFIGIKLNITKQIVTEADRYTDHKMCDTYRIPYLYLIFKFTQLYGEKHAPRTIPLKASKSWLEKADEWWKTVCKKDGLKFIPSVIYVVSWNKQEQLEKFAGCLKHMGLNYV
jgi:hypothetical protein